ncbi:MAG: ABC-F family ATP-binding cassette domain-containing protein [Oscillospiraceae bacterium]|nr:ABC-F family ATP-binding cassette domain-containing protein [Oscillospiraceae bacterium]MDY2677326.1 ABC-F family ATP-binding cassette domain-containing protein [Oscillospiraceae bacterium]
MSLLTAQNLQFGFSDGILFKDAAFKIENTDRVGLIGANGTGKTTLFKLITGEYSPQEGAIVKSRDLNIGYMEQYLPSNNSVTLYNEVLTVFSDVAEMEKELEEINCRLLDTSDEKLIERQLFLNEEIERRDGLVYKAKTRSALLGLGFLQDELELPVSALSGGQRSKAALCKLLLSNSHLLLLDEPTNNLDIEAVTWLEDFLAKYKGAFIVVSHDRYFLDKVTTSTMEIAHKKIYFTKGNYTLYHKLKAERELSIEREYEKNITEIKRIEEIIEQQKRFNQARNYVTIASKQKQIDRIKEQLVMPESAAKSVHFSFECDLRAGDEVLVTDGLKKGFDGKELFSDLSLTVRRNERVFILGPNGCGKSTFLKIINREISQDKGTFRYGVNVKKGYFAQNIENVNVKKTALDDVWDMYPSMTETEVRSALAMFLFCGDDVYKTVASLSGGEKAKLSLLKIMLKKPNFLILDEPTNHLDISSREVLENALLSFGGTLLCVSHDRYFINKLATRVIYLSHDGAVEIEGNYDDYLNYLENSEKTPEASQKPIEKPKVNDYKLKKEQASNERKRLTQLKRTEAEIEEKENRISEIETKLSLPETAEDYKELMKLTEELDALKCELDKAYALWEKLQEQ